MVTLALHIQHVQIFVRYLLKPLFLKATYHFVGILHNIRLSFFYLYKDHIEMVSLDCVSYYSKMNALLLCILHIPSLKTMVLWFRIDTLCNDSISIKFTSHYFLLSLALIYSLTLILVLICSYAWFQRYIFLSTQTMRFLYYNYRFISLNSKIEGIWLWTNFFYIWLIYFIYSNHHWVASTLLSSYYLSASFYYFFSVSVYYFLSTYYYYFWEGALYSVAYTTSFSLYNTYLTLSKSFYFIFITGIFSFFSFDLILTIYISVTTFFILFSQSWYNFLSLNPAWFSKWNV